MTSPSKISWIKDGSVTSVVRLSLTGGILTPFAVVLRRRRCAYRCIFKTSWCRWFPLRMTRRRFYSAIDQLNYSARSCGMRADRRRGISDELCPCDRIIAIFLQDEYPVKLTTLLPIRGAIDLQQSPYIKVSDGKIIRSIPTRFQHLTWHLATSSTQQQTRCSQTTPYTSSTSPSGLFMSYHCWQPNYLQRSKSL